jgi:hypothetical protein
MTAVMRAMPRPDGHKALRVALVRGGRVIDERVLPRGANLTIGPTEHSTFVVPGLRSSVRLIEHVRGAYRLNPAPGARGRIAREGEAVDLAQLTGPLPLDDTARGKIALGDALVLFHFVEPTVPAPRPALPIAVKQGLLGDADWRTTIIAAFSFLFHFGALGTVYSDYADDVVDEGSRVLATVQTLRELPAPPPLEVPHAEAASGATDKPSDTAQKTVSARPGGGTARPGPSGGGGGGKLSNERAAAIASALDGMDGAMVLAIGGKGHNAIDRVLEHGENPTGMLDGVAGDASGVRTAGVAGLNMNASPGVVRPGERPRGLPGDPGPVTNVNDSGKQAEVKKPVPSTTVAPPEMGGGTVPGAGATIGGLKGMLRACYKRTLDEDPTARGTVRVTAKIAPNGDVASTQAANSGLPAGMVTCVSRVVKGAQFNAPEGGVGAVLVIPMTFIPQ